MYEYGDEEEIGGEDAYDMHSSLRTPRESSGSPYRGVGPKLRGTGRKNRTCPCGVVVLGRLDGQCHHRGR